MSFLPSICCSCQLTTAVCSVCVLRRTDIQLQLLLFFFKLIFFFLGGGSFAGITSYSFINRSHRNRDLEVTSSKGSCSLNPMH